MQLLVLGAEPVFARQGIQKLLLDDVRLKLIGKDNVEVYAPQGVVAAPELVKAKFDHWQEHFYVREASSCLFSEDAPVSIQEDVIIYADNFEFCWERF
jgi:hypothetical protein